MNRTESEFATGPQDESDRMRQLLCAHLLGEASVEEAAEVQRALESSAELRAERARLEATIGLMRGALGGPQAASPELAARIERLAAERHAPAARQADLFPPVRSEHATFAARGRWRRAALPLAAGVAAVFGVYALTRWNQSSRPMELTAKLDEAAPASRDAQAEGRERAAQVAPQDAALDRPVPESAEVYDDAKEDKNESVALDVTPPKEPMAEAPFSHELEKRQGDAALGATGGLGGNPLELVDQVGQTVARVQVKDGPASGVRPGDVFHSSDAEDARNKAVLGAEPRLLKPEERKSLDSLGYLGGDYRGTGDTVPADGSVPARVAAPQPDKRAPVATPPAAAEGVVSMERASASPPSTPAPAPVHTRALAAGESAARSAAPAEAGGEGKAGEAHRFDSDESVFEALGTFERGEAGGADDFYLGKGAAKQPRQLSSEDCERWTSSLLRACEPRPGERPRDMYFRWWGDNPFVWTKVDALSTFAVDVDSASYTLARKYLRDGYLPEKAQIRTEEFVNAFQADVAAPSEDTFAVACEMAPDPFAREQDRWLLRVALRGRDVPRAQRQPLRLTFVVDVSGSMREGGRLEMVKHALRLLAHQLDERDEISIVTFTNDARIALPMTPATRRDDIESAIHPLTPQQGTNAQAGLRMGFELMAKHMARGASHRVVLLSDGVANVGSTDAEQLTRETEGYRKQGILLSTIGVGMNNHNDALLEQLADKGDGICTYIDDEKEAREALVDRFTSAFEVIARDTKIQVEFNPAQVEQYRLLGYENRAVADHDFRNDAVDAGEVHSGHQVIALYEIVRAREAASEAPLSTVRVRWKQPYVDGLADAESDFAREQTWQFDSASARGTFEQAGPGYRTSVLVAQFAEFLRRSVHARNDSFEQLVAEVTRLERESPQPEVREFAELVRQSERIVRSELARYSSLQRCYDELRQQRYLVAQIDELRLELGEARRQELERERKRLEEELRDLMRKRCRDG